MFVNFLCRTDCCFSPDNKLLLTGTSVKREQGSGKLVFFDKLSFKRVYEIEVTNAVRFTTRHSTMANIDKIDSICWVRSSNYTIVVAVKSCHFLSSVVSVQPNLKLKKKKYEIKNTELSRRNFCKMFWFSYSDFRDI